MSDPGLREVVESLAGLERRAGSAAEREAAYWLAERLTTAGAPATVEEVEFLDGYAKLLLPLGLAGVAAGILALAGRRRTAVAMAALSTAALIDDVSNGTRLWRRLVAPRKATWNVVAEAGDRSAQRTLVVMAHHDAAPTGLVFDQSFQRWLARRFPDVVARIDTSLPLWWPVASGPILVALGALGRRRQTMTAGTALSAAVVALALDVARDRVVPGANDNLSGVAALVALAGRWSAPGAAPGLRVLLVSCGAEEVIQGGIYAFAERHFPDLDPDRTWFMNLDTVGSPQLLLVEGEGPFRMEDYCDPGFRDLIAEVAREAGRPVRRGVRARASTDAVLTSRAGYPTATLASWEPETKLLSNYHLMSDTPENMRFETVEHAVALVSAVAARLAAVDGRPGRLGRP